MRRKTKYSYDQKVQACEDYLSGRKGAAQIAQELSMPKSGDSKIRKWAHQYEKLGAEILQPKKHNQKYTKEFKYQVVQEYLKGEGSYEELANRHGLSDRSTVRQWVMKYTKGEEIKEYDPYPEVYMASPRKTTYEERLEIVKDCIEHGKNYKKTASEYKCSYSQVRNWVFKYEKDGEEALQDRRGQHKKDEELSEVEQLKRKVARLERQLQEEKDTVELLKKVKEFERRRYSPKGD
ncbi:MAG: helix-turn-helix domain-containing protein [Erysipelotrichaceae bacterium]|nr:helix-turn-helix domain-containing protein [Erysipelotrichaceae bacterium]MBQ4252794.1 helix-turn-helix domain-containing protein [Erysipelotrichaceae bacterium]